VPGASAIYSVAPFVTETFVFVLEIVGLANLVPKNSFLVPSAAVAPSVTVFATTSIIYPDVALVANDVVKFPPIYIFPVAGASLW
jgi:hypothetical protein